MARRGSWVLSGRRSRRSRGVGTNRRLGLIHLGLVAVLVLVAGKLVLVQAVEADALSAASQKQRITTTAVPAERGSILDQHGNVLAFSSEARQLYVQPRELGRKADEEHAKDPSKPDGAAHKREIAQYVHQVVGDQLPEQQVLDALNKDTKFTYFGPVIDPAKAKAITDRYSEIGAEYRSTREYPAGTTAANIIGAANWRAAEGKVRGVLGLESSLNQALSGRDGEQVADTARGSNLVIPGTERMSKPAVPGSDVQLTLDSDLQFITQQKLADYARRAGAKGGTAVVLDAKTGQVRAMADDKTFDPANSQTWTRENLGDQAVTSPYEPGSVNKLITAAGAIQNGVVRPDTPIDVPPKLQVADRQIGDAWKHGDLRLTFTGVLAKSSNIGTLLTAQKLGPDKFDELVRKFGLGQRTGIGLPGESPGFVPDRKDWSGSTFANLPIGQGLSMTALQMTDMYQAIANNGVRVPPRIIQSRVLPDGTRVPEPKPQPVPVVDPQTARTVRDMLRAVVQQDPKQKGTGPDAALDGYQVSGKTGTAQQPDPATGRYSQSKYWITFAGMVPANDPRYVVGIMLDAPQGHTKEGTSAAPLFHDIATYLTQRYNVPLSPGPAPVQTLQLPGPP
jgi:cell division protein FtsI (penicillin-binding protein 3)